MLIFDIFEPWLLYYNNDLMSNTKFYFNQRVGRILKRTFKMAAIAIILDVMTSSCNLI